MANSEETPQPSTTPATNPPAPQEASSAGKPSGQGQETEQESRQPGQDLTAQAKDVAVQGREYVRTWPTQLEQQVREKPLQSLLMATGIGLLLGLLWRR
jgi:ElaB/YqjD/DUF883 family membrane-anchored ribosome-binding protein